MKSRRLIARSLIATLLERALFLENKARIEALKNKHVSIKTFYDYYLKIAEKNPEKYTSNGQKIKDTELQWIANKWDGIMYDYSDNISNNNIPDYELNSTTPPIDPFTIEDISKIIVDFIKVKQQLNDLYKKSKNSLTEEDLKKESILGSDINRYEDLSDLKRAVLHLKSKDEIVMSTIGGNDLPSNVSLGTFNGYELTVPQNVKESVGFDSDPDHKTTTWCTTRRTGQNLFDNYTLRGGILFYFKKKDVSDEEAAKKESPDSKKYLDPYTRFCIGIGAKQAEPNFPVEGAGYGGLIVDQDNNGVWEEKAKEILGGDFDSAIEKIKEYTKETNCELPFAKSFFAIIRSGKAVKETVGDWTWPEKYKFLIDPDNRNSILKLKELANTKEMPGVTAIAYAEKFKKDFDKDMKKIMSAPSGAKAAANCFFGIKKFKNRSICDDILFKKLLNEPKATIDIFFDELVFKNKTLSYFEEKGYYDKGLIDIYLQVDASEDNSTSLISINNFDDWMRQGDDYQLQKIKTLNELTEKVNSSVCELSKKEIKEQIEKTVVNLPLNTFNQVSADLITDDNLTPEKLKHFDLHYKKLFDNYSTLINREDINDFTSKCIDTFQKLINNNVQNYIRSFSQNLSLEDFLTRSASILESSDPPGDVFNVYDADNKTGGLEELNVFNVLSDYSKTKIKEKIAISFFQDVLTDGDPANVLKFSNLVSRFPNKFFDYTKKYYSAKDFLGTTLKYLVLEINSSGNDTTLQDFITTSGVNSPQYAGVVKSAIRFYASDKNDSSKGDEFIDRVSRSSFSRTVNSLEIIEKLALSNFKGIDSLAGMGNIIKTVLETEGESKRAAFDENTKLYIIDAFISSYLEKGMSIGVLFDYLLEKNVQMHKGDNLPFFEKIYSNSENGFLQTAMYTVKNANLIEDTIESFMFRVNSMQSKISYNNFKRALDVTNNERIVFNAGHKFLEPFTDEQAKDFVQRAKSSNYNAKHASISEDLSTWLYKIGVAFLINARSIEDVAKNLKQMKEADKEFYNNYRIQFENDESFKSSPEHEMFMNIFKDLGD